MSALQDRIDALKSEIVTRVKSIEALKEEKKTISSNYNERIKTIESEKKKLLEDLEEAGRAELTLEADEILVKNNSVELVNAD